ncbi:MAG: hypothetical protein ACOX81_02085 [Candidatus Heteroscillospira sp.]
MRRVYTLLVENKPGCLDRIAGFTRRYGWNIISMVAAETPDKNITKITIALECNKFCELPDSGIEQLSFVLEMHVCTEDTHTFHEVLVARGDPNELAAYTAAAARVDTENNVCTAWWLGDDGNITLLEKQLCALPGVKTVRSGPMALERWEA